MFELLTKIQRIQIDHLWEIPVDILCHPLIIRICVGEGKNRRRWFVSKDDDENTRNITLLEICEYVVSLRNARV